LDGYDQHCAALAATLRREGIDADMAAWKHHSWFHRLDAALAEIDATVPQGASFILLDDETWGREEIFGPGRARPLLEREGVNWGPPGDDDVAVAEFERMRADGAHFLVLAWPAFWWLDYYPRFFEHVRSRSTRLRKSQQVEIYQLSTSPPGWAGGV
jgi:hypothetical protein